jgi:hypothetical protein
MLEMSENTPQKMDGKRLREVAEYLFPDAGRSWKAKVAGAVKVHVTTVRRWVNGDSVPGGYDGLLEALCVIKQKESGK